MWANLYDDNGYTTWAAGTTYYWPDGKLTFIAYAPSSVNVTVDGEGVHFPDYSVADAATDQIDLLYSERAYDKQALDDETAGSEITDGNLATSAAEWDEPSTKNTTYVAYDGLEGTAAITRDIDGTPLNDEAIVVNTMTL